MNQLNTSYSIPQCVSLVPSQMHEVTPASESRGRLYLCSDEPPDSKTRYNTDDDHHGLRHGYRLHSSKANETLHV